MRSSTRSSQPSPLCRARFVVGVLGLLLLTVSGLGSYVLYRLGFPGGEESKPAGQDGDPSGSVRFATVSYENVHRVHFEENRGQHGERVRYSLRDGRQSLFFTDQGIDLYVGSRARVDEQPDVRVTYPGARLEPRIEGRSRQPSTVNYLLGSEPSRWYTRVPGWATIVYHDLYDGIDLVYRYEDENLKRDFILAPGSRPERLRMVYQGADRLYVRYDGALVVETARGTWVEDKPVVYQEINGDRKAVPGRYRIEHRNEVGFDLGSYDPEYPLVIDPALTFSTYLGGSQIEGGTAVAVDRQGNVYVAGVTTSPDFPVHKPLQSYQGGMRLGADAYVAKISKDGALVYTTYLGGTDDESASALAVDEAGNVYIVGGTASDDFPVQNALQGYLGGSRLQTDGFLARLNAGGERLDFSSYFGGTEDDVISDAVLDSAGNLYVTGTTASIDLPMLNGSGDGGFSGGFVTGTDAFVAKFQPQVDGTLLPGSAAFLGGSFDEFGTSITLDAQGNVIVAGMTNSTDFPILNPIQPAYAGPLRPFEGDLFVAQLDGERQDLLFATFLGGSGDDQVADLTVDAGGYLYLAGWTRSKDFPVTPGVLQETRLGPVDAMIVKLAPERGRMTLDYATYLGGTGEDEAYAVVADEQGRVVVGGRTTSEDFPTNRATQEAFGRGLSDGFITRLNNQATNYLESTFLGGSDAENVGGLSLTGNDRVCATGGTSSNDYPLLNQLQQLLNGMTGLGRLDQNAFVTCLDFSLSGVPIEMPPTMPDSYLLHQNYPNPFHASTTIRFDVIRQGRVTLVVFDVAGRRVGTIVDAVYAPGRYSTQVHAESWASGAYVYTIRMGDYTQSMQMTLVK